MAYTVSSGDTLSGIAKKLGVSLADLEAANPMPNFNKISVGQQLTVPGQGGGGGQPAAGNQQNAIDLNTALDEYGAVGVFAQSNPEVKAKLDQAVREGWDAARFQRELWTTNWFKAQSDNQRQLQVLQATDPQTYNSNLSEKAAEINQLAIGLGLTGVNANSLAQQALWNGWSSSVLQQHIVDSGQARLVQGQATGSLGDYQNQVRSTFNAYGVNMTDSWYAWIAKEIAAGRQTVAGMQNEAIGYGSALYPQYTNAFKSGKTLSDIAEPYIQQMSQTLEMDPSAINLSDRFVQQALHGDGKNPTPLWQFQNQLRQDPRWQKTANAKNAAFDVLAKIGQDWGFAS